MSTLYASPAVSPKRFSMDHIRQHEYAPDTLLLLTRRKIPTQSNTRSQKPQDHRTTLSTPPTAKVSTSTSIRNTGLAPSSASKTIQLQGGRLSTYSSLRVQTPYYASKDSATRDLSKSLKLLGESRPGTTNALPPASRPVTTHGTTITSVTRHATLASPSVMVSSPPAPPAPSMTPSVVSLLSEDNLKSLSDIYKSMPRSLVDRVMTWIPDTDYEWIAPRELLRIRLRAVSVLDRRRNTLVKHDLGMKLAILAHQICTLRKPTDGIETIFGTLALFLVAFVEVSTGEHDRCVVFLAKLEEFGYQVRLLVAIKEREVEGVYSEKVYTYKGTHALHALFLGMGMTGTGGS
ncbi:hypothetical protein HDV05_007448 [Chytridiales sp. JEL 0842]|nr:hypothetical protein HDV05_007448 [Chytridiales sp. JEL 0842]